MMSPNHIQKLLRYLDLCVCVIRQKQTFTTSSIHNEVDDQEPSSSRGLYHLVLEHQGATKEEETLGEAVLYTTPNEHQKKSYSLDELVQSKNIYSATTDSSTLK